jgi:hypothetical protein
MTIESIGARWAVASGGPGRNATTATFRAQTAGLDRDDLLFAGFWHSPCAHLVSGVDSEFFFRLTKVSTDWSKCWPDQVAVCG